ncbi:hypothetical protein [Robertkochia flava]|uniref:hypothetical protein n=1 Tax=Robertkochia flava TaxID=3447986 RepID=UPI001CCD19DD|nr:hypothetical protein [Robertkochia marina]
MRLSNWFICFLIGSVFCFNSCSLIEPQEDDLHARITLDPDISKGVSGEVSGDGGNEVRILRWTNPETTATLNLELVPGTDGNIIVRVHDAERMEVLKRYWSLEDADGAFVISGVSAGGASGLWSVSISLSNFEGDGSYAVINGN